MREIVFDTETTGLDFASDRVVEIGCVELVNHFPTGRTFHHYLNPDRAMSVEAREVHGLSDEFLADKPRFSAVAEAFLEFIEGGLLIAHNAEFDLRFMNAELARLGYPPIEPGRVVDSLTLARRRHPASPNSLDALCLRYGIDLSRRALHGALLDASLLAEVYIELIGGRQAALFLGESSETPAFIGLGLRGADLPPRPGPRPVLISAAEIAAHRVFVEGFEAPPLWRAYLPALAAE